MYAAFVGGLNNIQSDVEDTNAATDVFLVDLRDLNNISRRMVSVNATGTGGGNGDSGVGDDPVIPTLNGFPQISADGRFVAFSSQASDLVTGVTDANDGLTGNLDQFRRDVFLRDMQNGTTRLISSAVIGGRTGDNGSYTPVLSADASVVAFVSRASDLAGGIRDGNRLDGVFVKDLANNHTELASRRSPLVPAEVLAPLGIDSLATTSFFPRCWAACTIIHRVWDLPALVIGPW